MNIKQEKIKNNERKHFMIIPTINNIPEKPPPPSHPFPAPRGSTNKRIKENFELIYEKYLNTKKIYDDGKYYFILTFTIPITSRKGSSVLENLKINIIHIYNKNTIKVSIERRETEEFLNRLYKSKQYIRDVSPKSETPVISSKLKEILHNDYIIKTFIEVINLSGLKDIDRLENSFAENISKEEEIILGYHNSQKALFNAKLKPATIEKLANSIEIISIIDKLPEIQLDAYEDRNQNFKHEHIEPSIRSTRDIPIVCVVDSGINRNHNMLKDNIFDTFDYSQYTDLEDNTCKDDNGHGSLVSSIAIYRGDIGLDHNPLSNIFMVKAFNKERKILPFNDKFKRYKEIFYLLSSIIEKFKNSARVFNFSFSTDCEMEEYSKNLDDLIYKNDVIVVCSAGNICKKDIITSLNSGDSYPNYIYSHKIFFPGDCKNLITVGALATSNSDICFQNHPSPFTRCGLGNRITKPDVLENGGNMNMVTNNQNQIVDLVQNNLGVRGASHNSPDGITEDVGTSFATPMVACLAANILNAYPNINAFLVKAIILSSSNQLNLENNNENTKFLQGFGRPNMELALYTTIWRSCYLLQGTFSYSREKTSHIYSFYFPKNANRMTVTLTIGKKSHSKAFLSYHLIRAGSSSHYKPKHQKTIEDEQKEIKYSHKKTIDITTGGKGEWTIEIIPHLDNLPLDNDEVKYGCVITVESTQRKNIYSELANKIESISQREEEIRYRQLVLTA